MEKILSAYYNPSNPGSYGGRERLFRQLQNEGISRKDVSKFLEGEETYQLHKDRKSRFNRNKVISYSKDWNWQADLVDLSKLARYNQGYRYILVVIDVMTKYAWARCMKTKQAGDIKRAFENIFELDGRKPVRLQTDRGTEFTSDWMRNFYKNNDIYYFTTFTKTFKCSIVERLNRTIKSRMFRYFTRNNSKSYVHVLEKLMKSYNNSYHSSIQMTPKEACNTDPKILFRLLYGDLKKSKNNVAISIGDNVRIAHDRSTFDKAYEQTYSQLMARIKHLDRFSENPIFTVEDLDGSKDNRRFYKHELQKIAKPEVDKVIKRQGAKRLVTFRNYSGNQWIR